MCTTELSDLREEFSSRELFSVPSLHGWGRSEFKKTFCGHSFCWQLLAPRRLRTEYMSEEGSWTWGFLNPDASRSGCKPLPTRVAVPGFTSETGNDSLNLGEPLIQWLRVVAKINAEKIRVCFFWLSASCLLLSQRPPNGKILPMF